jgi:hypothetical protein
MEIFATICGTHAVKRDEKFLHSTIRKKVFHSTVKKSWSCYIKKKVHWSISECVCACVDGLYAVCELISLKINTITRCNILFFLNQNVIKIFASLSNKKLLKRKLSIFHIWTQLKSPPDHTMINNLKWLRKNNIYWKRDGHFLNFKNYFVKL